MSERHALVDAYASLARGNGIALYGSADSLRDLARIIRVGPPADIDLLPPLEGVLEVAPLRTIRVLTGARESIDLRVSGEVIKIAGGSGGLNKLSASLENLADTPEVRGLVPRHINLEYFPGHGFLGDGSTWMTVTLLPISSPVTESFDAAYYADLEADVLRMVRSVEDRFPPERTAVLIELAEHNEPAVAVEMLSEMLVEVGDPVTPALFEGLRRAAKTMRLEPDVAERLLPLVRAG